MEYVSQVPMVTQCIAGALSVPDVPSFHFGVFNGQRRFLWGQRAQFSLSK